MKKWVVLMLSVSLMLSLLSGCGSQTGKKEEDKSASKGDKIKVRLITMDSIDQHWVNVNKGAEKAATELGNVDLKWMAPDKKDDAQQIERVNNALADGAQAIVIAANGPDAISQVLEEAKKEGVKIVYVDSPAKVEAEITYSTNNQAAGETAGKTMIEELKARGIEEGSIGVVNVNASTDSTIKREAGFREAFAGSKFTILETQYGEGDVAKSQDIATNYITQGCVGIFGANEGSTVGAGNAIKSDGNKVVGVGFDKSDAILELIKGESILATMAQNPETMGYEGVKAAIEAVGGKTFDDKTVDTGVSVINKDSLK